MEACMRLSLTKLYQGKNILQKQSETRAFAFPGEYILLNFDEIFNCIL